jgi:hypothetical protein
VSHAKSLETQVLHKVTDDTLADCNWSQRTKGWSVTLPSETVSPGLA